MNHIKTTFNDWNFEKKVTALIIHGFAIAHAVTAFTLSQTVGGDELALTALTIAMIECIARANGRDWDAGEALSIMGIILGSYIGIRLGVMFVKLFPGPGNLANATATFLTTEFLGWLTYAIVKQDKNPSQLTKEEKEELKKAAKKLQKDKTGEELYKKMSAEDKEKFNDLMKQFAKIDRDNDAERERLIQELEEITKKYG